MPNQSRDTRRTIILLMIVGLPALSALVLWIEHLTHVEFLLHVAAIPLEVLLGAFIVERWLARAEKEGRRRQLMYLKSYLFRSEMRDVFISNFSALVKPALSLQWIREAGLAELVQARDAVAELEYRSPEAMEQILERYRGARHAFQTFMEWAAEHDFESIFHDMIFILHFVQDYRVFKDRYPDRLFVEEAQKHPRMRAKIDKILRDGVVKFLDYAIEMRQKEPDVLDDLLDDYLLSSTMRR
jgi:hypothetical protein